MINKYKQTLSMTEAALVWCGKPGHPEYDDRLAALIEAADSGALPAVTTEYRESLPGDVPLPRERWTVQRPALLAWVREHWPDTLPGAPAPTAAPAAAAPEPLLTMPEIEKLLGKSGKTVYRWIKAGQFPAPAPGMPGRWRQSDVVAWQASKR